jgi:alkylation response protein AidB-like acyl-CoA dehydrogenase
MSDKQFIKGGSFLLGKVDAEAVYTPEDFTEEHRMIAETTSDFVEGEIVPHDEEIEKLDYELTVKLLRKAGELGLLGADIPEEFGGVGLDKISSTLIGENMINGFSFALSHGAHVGIGTLPIVIFGNRKQKEKYLPDLATGAKIAAYALTEPTSGSDALSAKTVARLSEDGQHYILNGAKQFITNAGFADVFVVYAKIDGDKFTAFIVDRDTSGFNLGPEEKKMGIKGSSTRPLIFEDAKVPVENVLWEMGRGHVIAFNILNIGRYKLAVGALGSSKAAIKISTEYAKQRTQFNTQIANFPLIREKLADMNVQTFVLESLVYRTVGLYDEIMKDIDMTSDDSGKAASKAIEEYAIECSINKVFGSEVMDFVVDEAVQIHGGYGFIQEYKVERMYRDSRINRIFEGTNEVNRLLIPGTLFKKGIKGELPLLQATKTLQGELMGMMPQTDFHQPLEREHHLVDIAKKVFLMIGGLAAQKYQQNLDKQQELLANLADIAIEIFAMESAVLRAQKTLNRFGSEKATTQMECTQVYVNDAFLRIDITAKESLAAMEVGDVLRTQLSILKKLMRHSPINTIALKRSIAAKVVESEGYVSLDKGNFAAAEQAI